MTAARRAIEREGSRTLLALLERAPRTGAELAAGSGLAEAAFQAAASALWTVKLLQGEVADGCCRDPCGATCVCAMQRACRWSLTRKGRSAATRLRATDRRRDSPTSAADAR